MKILLMRHGEQQYPYNNVGKKLVCGVDAPLVDLGRQQLRELRYALDREGFVLDAVYRSPLLRAKQSTEELVGGQAIPVYEVDGLKEVFPNRAEGKTYDELEAIGGDIYAHPFAPDQETLEHLVLRQRETAEFILGDAKKRGYNTIGILGHGDPLCGMDWALKNENQPVSYAEMRDSYYPQKAQAKEYIIDSDLKLESEGRIITTEAAKATIEGFRDSGKEQE